MPKMRQSSITTNSRVLKINPRAGTLVHSTRNDRAKVTVSQATIEPPALLARLLAPCPIHARIRGLTRKQTTCPITRETRSMHLTPQWRKTWMSREKRPDYRSLRSRCMWAVRNSPVPPSNGWKKVTVMNYFTYFYAPRPIRLSLEPLSIADVF